MAERNSILWKSKKVPISREDIELSRVNKDNLPDFLFTISKEDINYNTIMNIFGEFNNTRLANPYDLLEVPPHTFSYYTDIEKTKSVSNSSTFVTTVGLYIYNIFLRDFNFSRLFETGYINSTLSDKGIGDIEQTLSYALLEDRITTDELRDWEDLQQWLMPFETVLTPNYTEKYLTCTKVINKKKQELLKKYAKEVEAGDIDTVDLIEKELLKFAEDYLGDDPAFDSFRSGAGGSISANFKNLFCMKGVMENPDPYAKKKFTTVTGNYMDGINPEEYSVVAGGGAQGAYFRAKKTEGGGYLEKLVINAYQHLKLDPPGSDCGTKRFIEVEMTKDNIKDYMYSYVIKNNGQLQLIDSTNYKDFIDKKVKLRFSSMCESKTGICNKCAGELFYKLNNPNVGLILSQIPDTLKLRAMKYFHTSSLVLSKMDPMKTFFPYEKSQ